MRKGVRGDLVMVRHAPTTPAPGVPSSAWQLAPGAMERTAALAMALAKVRLAAPGDEGALGPLDAIVSSVEAKALGTAKTLGLVLGLQSVTGTDLEEHRRANVPHMADAEFKRTMRRFFARPDVLVFGNETADEAKRRFLAGVGAAVSARPGKRLAVVSHGTVIALALAKANDVDPFTLWESLRLPEAIVVRQSDWRIIERLALEE